MQDEKEVLRKVTPDLTLVLTAFVRSFTTQTHVVVTRLAAAWVILAGATDNDAKETRRLWHVAVARALGELPKGPGLASIRVLTSQVGGALTHRPVLAKSWASGYAQAKVKVRPAYEQYLKAQRRRSRVARPMRSFRLTAEAPIGTVAQALFQVYGPKAAQILQRLQRLVEADAADKVKAAKVTKPSKRGGRRG